MSDEKFKVLVVEDYGSLNKNLVRLFNGVGIEAAGALSVTDAIDYLNQHKDVDLVTLDGDMGARHGREVAEHIVNVLWPQQAEAACGKTAFVVISGIPFEPEGVSEVYDKGVAREKILCADGGIKGWLRHMKSLVPA